MADVEHILAILVPVNKLHRQDPAVEIVAVNIRHLCVRVHVYRQRPGTLDVGHGVPLDIADLGRVVHILDRHEHVIGQA